MIQLFSGTPGSGKSLHAASLIYWHARRNRPILANFAVNLNGCCPDLHSSQTKTPIFQQVDNDQLSPKLLIKFAADFWADKRITEDYILLVIDEAQLLFNAREWDAQGRKAWTSFFTQHRKYGFKIVLVAQFDRMLDRQIRSLIEYEFVHRKVSNFGWKGVLLSSVMGGKMFVAVKIWYPMHEKVGSEFFRAKKSLFALYDTYGTFGASEPVAAPAVGRAGGPGVGGPPGLPARLIAVLRSDITPKILTIYHRFSPKIFQLFRLKKPAP